MSKRHNILPTGITFFVSGAKKLKVCRSSKLNFSSNCFLADYSHIKLVWQHLAAFSEHDILHF